MTDYTGTTGNDSLIGGTGADLFAGDAGNDTLSGLAGNDVIYGYNGLDTLDGGTGADVMYGGKHSDVYIVDSIGDQVMEYTGEGDEDTVVSSINYTLYTPVTSNFIENIELSGTANLTATGNGLDNTLTGNRGNNSLSGGGGNDLLRGQALGDTLAGGDDTLDGGIGDDTMYGALGNDLYYVDSADDEVIEQFEQGIDTVFSSLTAYTLEQYVENLVLSGAALNGTGNGENNLIEGNSANNLLSGGANQDTLIGGLGNDTLDGGLGDDLMQGGAGNDVYRVNTINDVSDESTLGASGVDLVEATASHTLGTGVENLKITSSAAVNGTGNALDHVLTGGTGKNLLDGGLGDDSLYGGGGDDTLIGGSGTDSLAGGAGNDTLDGGAGDDTYFIDSASDSIVEVATGGTDRVYALVSHTLGTNVENIELIGTAHLAATGNAKNNLMTGNTGNNLVSGGSGSDVLTGNDGDDTLDGGLGNDTLIGGAGNDTFVIDVATDVIVETAGGGTDTVMTALAHILADTFENLSLTGTGSVAGTGNAVDNVLTGNTGANALYGLAGNDTLTGGAGHDILDGGTGNDVYYVDNALDVVVEAADAGTDLLRVTTHATLGVNVENMAMLSTGAYRGTGNGLDNVMTGNSGKNTLSGMAGDDTLNGAAGADVLTGGAGADHFVFSSITAGNDTITDFNAVNGGAAEGDVLQFTGLLVGSFAYRGTAAFTAGSNNSEARFDTTTKKLLIDVDGNGVAEFALTLTGMDAASDVTAANFLWT